MICHTAKCLYSALVLMALLACTGRCFAQTAQERRWCEGEDGASVAQRIEGCSSVIKSARDGSDKLAETFNNRAMAYRGKGELDQAIQDYGQAIKLNGKLASLYNNRGVAYDRKSDFDRAIADYEQALKLNASAEIYFNRGNAYLAKAQFDHAVN